MTIFSDSEASLTTYVLEDERYARRGTKKPAIIVCPGGGYTEVSQNEGEPVALAFAHKGYHAFVLDCSVKIDNPFPKALLELAKAVSIVRGRADEWNIIKNKVVVCGFSAGGHLAASLGAFHAENFILQPLGIKADEIRPDAMVLGYPAFSLASGSRGGGIPDELIEKIEKGLMMDFRGPDIKQILTGKLDYSQDDLERVNLLNVVTDAMPPAFIFGSMADPIIPVTDLTHMAKLCRDKNIPCELHIFGNGAHGQGLYQPNCTQSELLKNQHMGKWFALALAWLGEVFM